MDISLYRSLEPHMSNGMSIFQMDHFVIKDSITPYRQLRQIIVETRARLENITSIGFDIEELQIKKEKAEKQISDLEELISSSEVDFEVRLLRVQVQRYNFELNRKQSILDQQNAEVQFFNNELADMVNNVFGGQEKLVSDLKNPTFHADNEKHFWTHKLARGVSSDLINFGTISKGVLEAIMNLPTEDMKQVLSLGTRLAEESRDALRISRDEAISLLDR